MLVPAIPSLHEHKTPQPCHVSQEGMGAGCVSRAESAASVRMLHPLLDVARLHSSVYNTIMPPERQHMLPACLGACALMGISIFCRMKSFSRTSFAVLPLRVLSHRGITCCFTAAAKISGAAARLAEKCSRCACCNKVCTPRQRVTVELSAPLSCIAASAWSFHSDDRLQGLYLHSLFLNEIVSDTNC